MQTTKEMRDRVRELATGRDDFDRAVLALLDDFEALTAQPIRPAPAVRSTHTYVELEVPTEVYDLVADKMLAAEYMHVFDRGPRALWNKDRSRADAGPIDMHGIALTRGPARPRETEEQEADRLGLSTPETFAEHAKLPGHYVSIARATCATLVERLAYLRGVVEATRVPPPCSDADVFVDLLEQAERLAHPGKPMPLADRKDVLRGNFTDRRLGNVRPVGKLADAMREVEDAGGWVDWPPMAPVTARGKWDCVRFALGDRGRGLSDEDIDAIVVATINQPPRPPVCPSGFAACSLNLDLPRSAAYAIEDRDATDAGLKRTAAERDDYRADRGHEKGRADEVAGLSREIGGDRAPCVGGTKQFKAFWDDVDARVRRGMFGAETPASPAPAAQDMPRALDLGGELRRESDDAAMGGGPR